MAKKLNLSAETRAALENEGLQSEPEWDGVTCVKTMHADSVAIRNQFSNAARNGQWEKLFQYVLKHKELLNTTRLGGTSLYAPLHQVAYAGASIEVATRLIELGAWRTLQNAQGERPVDVAVKRGHHHLTELLTPVYKHHVALGVLLRIQANFHAVILGRAEELVKEHSLRLPNLEPILELEEPLMWFPVPGMYGGFKYWLDGAGVGAKLITESWCRVAGGSGQRHEITSAGNKLVDEGFV